MKLTTLLLLALVLVVVGLPAKAKAVASATDGSGVVTLFDEPCKLTAKITNLPYRATWSEAGKTSEGCFSIMGPVVAFYFDSDKTVAIAPLQEFKVLTGA